MVVQLLLLWPHSCGFDPDLRPSCVKFTCYLCICVGSLASSHRPKTFTWGKLGVCVYLLYGPGRWHIVDCAEVSGHRKTNGCISNLSSVHSLSFDLCESACACNRALAGTGVTTHLERCWKTTESCKVSSRPSTSLDTPRARGKIKKPIARKTCLEFPMERSHWFTSPREEPTSVLDASLFCWHARGPSLTPDAFNGVRTWATTGCHCLAAECFSAWLSFPSQSGADRRTKSKHYA